MNIYKHCSENRELDEICHSIGLFAFISKYNFINSLHLDVFGEQIMWFKIKRMSKCLLDIVIEFKILAVYLKFGLNK